MKRRINQELAERFINGASLTAFIYGIAAIQMIAKMPDNVDRIFYINFLGFVFGCAYGIYKRSRTFAIIMFILFVLDRVFAWQSTDNLRELTGFGNLVFLGAFFCGIVGTFSHHNLMKETPPPQ